MCVWGGAPTCLAAMFRATVPDTPCLCGACWAASAKDWTQQVWAGRVDVMAKGAGAEVRLISPNGAWAAASCTCDRVTFSRSARFVAAGCGDTTGKLFAVCPVAAGDTKAVEPGTWHVPSDRRCVRAYARLGLTVTCACALAACSVQQFPLLRASHSERQWCVGQPSIHDRL